MLYVSNSTKSYENQRFTECPVHFLFGPINALKVKTYICFSATNT